MMFDRLAHILNGVNKMLLTIDRVKYGPLDSELSACCCGSVCIGELHPCRLHQLRRAFEVRLVSRCCLSLIRACSRTSLGFAVGRRTGRFCEPP